MSIEAPAKKVQKWAKTMPKGYKSLMLIKSLFF
jgi:hypothetical protein